MKKNEMNKEVKPTKVTKNSRKLILFKFFFRLWEMIAARPWNERISLDKSLEQGIYERSIFCELLSKAILRIRLSFIKGVVLLRMNNYRSCVSPQNLLFLAALLSEIISVKQGQTLNKGWFLFTEHISLNAVHFFYLFVQLLTFLFRQSDTL